MKSNLNLAIKTALFGGAMLTASSAFSADKELLDTLLSNGSINKAQHTKLSELSKNKAENEVVTKADLKAFEWASKIKIKGDMRYRYETQWGPKEKSRHRIRARIGIDAKPTDDLKISMRLATGGSATSTNATLDDGFNQKSFWLDRAYFDYSPKWAMGTHFIAGKMKQQWYQVSNNVWDSDLNPDGLAIKYSHQFGPAEITGLGGYYFVESTVNGETPESWNMDNNGISIGHYGLDAAFKLGKRVSLSVGHNGYLYTNAEAGDLGGNNDANIGFKIYEIASKLKIKTGLMPITLFAQYSGNSEVDSDGNAWTIGAKSKIKGFKFGYDYRSTEKNATVDAFNDSDFNGGKTDAKGHRIKLGYSFNKYFGIGATYFHARSISNPDQNAQEMVQLDLKAKF